MSEQPPSNPSETTSKVRPDEDRLEQLAGAEEELRQEMQSKAAAVRDLILVQPPIKLLGYLWSQFQFVLVGLQDSDDSHPSDAIQTYQFALEYVHATWSGHSKLVDDEAELDQKRAEELLSLLDELKSVTMTYCLVSSSPRRDEESSQLSEDVEFQAKSTWVLIRGNRYQVLEEEFFQFVLEPHSEALKLAYGLDSTKIASELQAIADSTRSGIGNAVNAIQRGMERTSNTQNAEMPNLKTALEAISAEDDGFIEEISGAFQDLFFGGICNVSRHTKLSAPLLEDLCYQPGENVEFFEEGPFSGTPLRTLPARIKPGIQINGEFYVVDPQFCRDSSYRAIQRGLLSRLPDYREEWNRRQKTLVEEAFPRIFASQLRGANSFSEVFFSGHRN